MAVAVADSWYAEDTGDTPTAVAVSGFQAGDIAVVICFSFNTVTSCTLDPPTDNGGNAYTERVENTRTGTFRSICSLSDAVIVTPPTSVTFNVAGATGLGQSICVLRLTGATLFDDADENQVTGDDPTSDAVTVTTDGIAIAGITYDGDGISLAATGWTTAEEVETSAASPFSVVYKQTTAGSTSAAWTTGSSADYSLVIAAYKAAAATTVSFPITDGNDDRGAFREGNAWPPVTNFGEIAGAEIYCSKYFTTPQYTNEIGFARWDTSSLPDDATITAATIKMYCTYLEEVGSTALVGDYYDFGGDAIVIGDYTLTASPSIFSPVDLGSITMDAVKSIPLTDLSGINKSGYTGIRFTLTDTGTPVGGSNYGFANWATVEHATAPSPVLEVSYTGPVVVAWLPINVHANRQVW